MYACLIELNDATNALVVVVGDGDLLDTLLLGGLVPCFFVGLVALNPIVNGASDDAELLGDVCNVSAALIELDEALNALL